MKSCWGRESGWDGEEGSVPRETKEALRGGRLPCPGPDALMRRGCSPAQPSRYGLTFDPVMLLQGPDPRHTPLSLGRACPTRVGIFVRPARTCSH